MWIILDAIRWTGVLFFALIAGRFASALVGLFAGREEDEERERDWRWWTAWAVLLSVGAALVDLQFGGFYNFNDPLGINWSFDGHGWPLIHQHSLLESVELNRAADVAIYFAALGADLLAVLGLLAATRFVVDRCLPAAAAAQRNWRSFGAMVAGWFAALVGVLWIERFFAGPVELPGTQIMIYTPLVHQPWYSRWPIVFALACALTIGGWWLSRGVKAFFRLRDEGVL